MSYSLFFALLMMPVAQASSTNQAQDDYYAYRNLYPTFVQYCSGSRYKEIKGVSGGAGGHGLVYVEGLCKDPSVSYPRVKVCEKHDLSTGAWISVNSDFKNVNWVVVPGYHTGLHGNIEEGRRITEAEVQGVVEDAIKKKIFEGVRIKPELTSGKEAGTEVYVRAVARNSVGTDYALRFARVMECARVPIQTEKISEMATALNQLNEKYYLGGKTYEWSAIRDNCTHTASLMLEKAGLRSAIPAGQPFHRAIFDLALPRNGTYTLLQRGIFASIKPWDVYRQLKGAKKLSQPIWLMNQAGALAKAYDAYLDNEVYSISKKTAWIIPKNFKNFDQARNAFQRSEFTDIQDNLRYWMKKYREMSGVTQAEYYLPEYLRFKVQSGGLYDTPEYNRFEERYSEYLTQKINFIYQAGFQD